MSQNGLEKYWPPKTNTYPAENHWLDDEISFWHGPFFGDMLNFQLD